MDECKPLAHGARVGFANLKSHLEAGLEERHLESCPRHASSSVLIRFYAFLMSELASHDVASVIIFRRPWRTAELQRQYRDAAPAVLALLEERCAGAAAAAAAVAARLEASGVVYIILPFIIFGPCLW